MLCAAHIHLYDSTRRFHTQLVLYSCRFTCAGHSREASGAGSDADMTYPGHRLNCRCTQHFDIVVSDTSFYPLLRATSTSSALICEASFDKFDIFKMCCPLVWDQSHQFSRVVHILTNSQEEFDGEPFKTEGMSTATRGARAYPGPGDRSTPLEGCSIVPKHTHT